MELALNLVWLCLAFAGYALLGSNLSRARNGSGTRASNRQKIVAMSCALIILFFVVSMTDDLHDQEVLVEDSKFLRAISSTGSPSLAAAHAAITHHCALFFGSTSYFHISSVVLGTLEQRDIPFMPESPRKLLSGRAPPSLI